VEVTQALQIIDDGPDFIREANFLTLVEQVQLVMAEADAPEETVMQAKRMVVDHFRAKHVGKKSALAGSVDVVFNACLESLLRGQKMVADDELFSNPARLLDAVVAKFAVAKQLNKAVIAGRPATEVLAERLCAMSPPEFALLAAVLLGSDDPARRWIAAIDAGDTKAKQANHKQALSKRPK
jgi:hypothetical protein